MVQGGVVFDPQVAPEPDQIVFQSHLLCAESMQWGILLSTISLGLTPRNAASWPRKENGVN
jgi:hypothetical protein